MQTLTCVQCGNDFEFSDTHRNKLDSRGFDAPKRCPVCRKHKNKTAMDENDQRRRDKKKHYRMKYDQY